MLNSLDDRHPPLSSPSLSILERGAPLVFRKTHLICRVPQPHRVDVTGDDERHRFAHDVLIRFGARVRSRRSIRRSLRAEIVETNAAGSTIHLPYWLFGSSAPTSMR
jgi:hypothetical protein